MKMKRLFAMMKTRKVWLAALLTMVMILSLPFSASAEGSNGTTATNTYKVMLELNGGHFSDPTTPLEMIVEEGNRVEWPGTPEKKGGFIFHAWYTDEECQNAYDFMANTPIQGDMTLYAGWDKIYYMTLDMNGGTFCHNEIITGWECAEGDVEDIPPVDQMEYWIEDPESGDWVTAPANCRYVGIMITDKYETKFYAPGETYTVKDSDAYLTVMWSPCTINIESEPSEGGTTTGSGSYENGKSVTLVAKANGGYTFVGWYEGQNCVSQEEKYTIDALRMNRNLTAKFQKPQKPCTITLNMNGGTIQDPFTSVMAETVSLDFPVGYTQVIPTVKWMEEATEDGTWITAPANSEYIGAEITDENGTTTYDPGVGYTVVSDATIKVLWKSTIVPPAPPTKHVVTYVVANGTWEDGTSAPKTEEVEDGKSPTQIPSGMVASEGFEGGAWNPDPNKATIGDNTSFTYTFTAKPAENHTYKVVSGSGGTYTKESGKTLGFTFKRSADDDTTFSHFTGIAVDGQGIPEKDGSGKANWTAKGGSVIIDLQPEYLDGLGLGKHTLTALFDDGSAWAEFTVLAKEEEKPTEADPKEEEPTEADPKEEEPTEADPKEKEKPADDKKAEPETEAQKQATKKSVDTGDIGNVWIWAIMIPAAVAGIAATVIFAKKRS